MNKLFIIMLISVNVFAEFNYNAYPTVPIQQYYYRPVVPQVVVPIAPVQQPQIPTFNSFPQPQHYSSGTTVCVTNNIGNVSIVNCR